MTSHGQIFGADILALDFLESWFAHCTFRIDAQRVLWRLCGHTCFRWPGEGLFEDLGQHYTLNRPRLLVFAFALPGLRQWHGGVDKGRWHARDREMGSGQRTVTIKGQRNCKVDKGRLQARDRETEKCAGYSRNQETETTEWTGDGQVQHTKKWWGRQWTFTSKVHNRQSAQATLTRKAREKYHYWVEHWRPHLVGHAIKLRSN